ncbi:MAG: hypothetical protein Q8R53_02595, partial [Nanoarchaeota archaeon]|nr:hypothetical protein [Nanoarchaeota archaeon]
LNPANGIGDACDVGAVCTSDASCGTGLRCGTGGICEEIPPVATEVCDGRDNDGDLQVDEGTLCPAGARCQVGKCIEFMCADTVDNDADSVADCLDTDCGGSSGPSGVTCCNLACAPDCRSFDMSGCTDPRQEFLNQMAVVYDEATTAGADGTVGWTTTLITNIARLLRSIFP